MQFIFYNLVSVKLNYLLFIFIFVLFKIMNLEIYSLL